MKVASYYGQVGLHIDRAGLRSAQAYFRSVERIVNNFQKRVSKNQHISIRFRIDRAIAQRDIQRAMNSVSKGVSIPIRGFSIKGSSIKRAVENSMPKEGRGSVAIGVRLSRGSLSTMRDQVRGALEGTVIRPRINPVIRAGASRSVASGGSGGGSRASGQTSLDPRNTRRMSPWHNPMMVGGGLGAFMRYGMFSLPLVGGVVGLNAYSNAAREFRAQETGLSFAAGLSTEASKQDVGFHRNYLHQVGERTGMKESLLSRDYHQMLAGSAGTKMEPHLQEGFLGLTQYSSILGLTDDSMRLVMRGGHAPYRSNPVLKTP